MTAVAGALLTLLAQVPVAPPEVTGDRSIVSKCEVSDDPKYGYTMDSPIRVGGLPMYGAARQQRYLRALAGPAGQAVRFRRRGAVGPNRDKVLIDLYDVIYEGLEKPIELYLDFYNWEPPKAPRGFVCATEIGLSEPVGVDPEHLRLAELAIEAARQGDVPPIPLTGDGSGHYGYAIDTFRFMAGAARALIRSGAGISPQSLSGIQGGQFLVVAHALLCDGQPRRPLDIEVLGVPASGGLLETGALRRLLPWATIPDDARGRVFGGPHLPPGGAVKLSYDGPACPQEATTVLLPVKAGPPRKIVDVPPVWPAALPPSMFEAPLSVELRARIDLDGVPEVLEVVNGPQGFVQAATDAVRQWRYVPFTINGEPAYAPIVMTVRISFAPRKDR